MLSVPSRGYWPRRRSIFEPLPSYTTAQLQGHIHNNPGRADRSIRRTHRQYQSHLESANFQLLDTVNPHAAWAALHNQNGNYMTMLTDGLRTKSIRHFGMHTDADRRYFFERTGRLSHVIHRARVFLRRRYVKLYETLRLILPQEIVSKVMTNYRSRSAGHTLVPPRDIADQRSSKFGPTNSFLLPDRRHLEHLGNVRRFENS